MSDFAFRLVERFPKLGLIVSTCILIGFWLVSGILHALDYEIAPIKLHTFPIQIRSSPWYRRAVSIQKWIGNYADIVFPDPPEFPETLIDKIKLDLYYKVDGNILTYDKLIRMKKIENEIISIKNFNVSFQKPISFLQMLNFYNNSTFTNKNITQMLATYFNSKPEESKEFRLQVFPTSFKIDENKGYSYTSLLRTVLIPAVGRIPPNIKKIIRPMLKRLWTEAENDSSYEFAYYNAEFYFDDFGDQASRDTLYAIGSFFFILIVLMLHMRSVVLSVSAIFGIISSVVGANLMYRIVFDQRYIGIFHCVSLFIALGIGADDVFVLFDAWRNTFNPRHPPSSLCHRLSELFDHAAKPMFITTLTSSAAFFVNGICKVPVISTFGLFTGLVLVINYLVVITFLPFVLVNQLLFYRWLGKRNLLLSCIPKWMRINNATSNHQSKKSQGGMTTFFEYYFFNFIKRKLTAIISLGLLLLFSGLAMWQATKLEPSKATLSELFAKGTNYYCASKFDKQFTQTRFLKVDIVWGINGLNDKTCHKHDFDCRGTVEMADEINLNLWSSQSAFLNFCQRLSNDTKLAKRLRIYRKNDHNSVNCFISDMQRDMLYQRTKKKYKCADSGLLDLTLPIGQKKIDRLMSCEPRYYGSKTFIETIKLDQWFHSFFETALHYWLLTSKPGKNVPLNSKVSMYTYEDVTTLWIPGIKNLSKELNTTEYFGGKLKFMTVRVTLNLTATSDTFFTGAVLRDEWERFIGETNLQFPLGLRGAFQCMSQPFPKSTINIWEWFDIQERLWNNARSGMLLGIFAVALPILFLTTKSILLTAVCVFCLSCITVSVMAMTHLAGWSLGITESINLAMVTGLSIDPLVHFVEAYSRSKEITRVGRVRDMLTQMGSAVTSGMITTVGATSFLFPTKMLGFIQFGTFMAATIGCAFCYTLFLLTPFLVLWGPVRYDKRSTL